MSEYAPDRWVVLEFVTPQETIRKVFAGWYGGFTDSDSWRLNSGITQIRKKDNVFEFDGYSGSTYYCDYNSYGMTSYMNQVLQKWVSKAEKDGSTQINIVQLEHVAQPE